MKCDNEGKLNFGELKDVTKIEVELERYGRMIYNLTNYSKYCYPERIDLIEGESFTLPFYLNNDEINMENLKNYFFIL